MSEEITGKWLCPEAHCSFHFNTLRNLAIHLIIDHDWFLVRIWDWLDTDFRLIHKERSGVRQ